MRRKRSERTVALSRSKNISAAPHRLNQLFLKTLVDLTTQPIDVHFDHIGHSLPVRFPKVLTEHFARHHLACVAHQEFEQAELGRRERNLRPAAGNLAICQVECERTGAERSRGTVLSTPA